jgi:hypothetical protein
MGLYFRKRVGLGPLALNVSKSGIGLSLGVRGFHAGIASSRRPYVSASIPGTGLYLRQYAHSHAPAHAITGGGPVSVPHPVGHAEPPLHTINVGYALGYLCGWLLFLVLPLLALIWLAGLIWSVR